MREPAGRASEPIDGLIAFEEHADRVARFQRPDPRERRELFLHAAGFRYAEICRISRGVHVNVAVWMGADVDDMSPKDAVVGLRLQGSAADASLQPRRSPPGERGCGASPGTNLAVRRSLTWPPYCSARRQIFTWSS